MKKTNTILGQLLEEIKSGLHELNQYADDLTFFVYLFTIAYMKERLCRLKTIRKLIKTQRIRSQDELLGHLNKENFDVTQATLSRDLKLLKVGKLSDDQSGYVYILPAEDERQEPERAVVQDFLRGYISIDFSGNIVVIKTYSGHSDVVSAALDALEFNEVLGTLSGNDNCVFACLREGVTADDFMDALKLRIPELE